MMARGSAWALLVAMAAPALARADTVDACVDGADRAQQLRDQGKLIEARTQLLVCGASGCPGAVAKQCVRWLHEVDDEMPTLSLRVRDGATDVTDVEVLVDDVSQATSLDGRPMPIDPGARRLTFHRGDVTTEQSLVARAGEKNRLVDVQLTTEPKAVVVTPAATSVQPPPPPPPPRPRGFHVPWVSGVFLGLGIASFAITVPLVVIAGNDAANLRRTCAPNCTISAVADVHTKLIVANVTFGVGIAGLALSAASLVVANIGRGGDSRSVSFGVAPLDRGGAMWAARGTF